MAYRPSPSSPTLSDVEWLLTREFASLPCPAPSGGDARVGAEHQELAAQPLRPLPERTTVAERERPPARPPGRERTEARVPSRFGPGLRGLAWFWGSVALFLGCGAFVLQLLGPLPLVESGGRTSHAGTSAEAPPAEAPVVPGVLSTARPLGPARPTSDPAEPPARAAEPAPPPRPAGTLQTPPPRPDLRALAGATAASFACGLVDAEADGDSISLSGVVRRDEAEGVGRMLDVLGVPLGVARDIRLQSFEGPFCGVLAAVREHAAPPGAAPRVRLDGPSPLLDGQPLSFRVETPGWQSRLFVAVLTASGEVLHLVRGQTVYGANVTIAFGDPRWRVAAPFGTDLLLVIASDRTLFGERREQQEDIGDFASALATVLRSARDAGGRVAVRVIPVVTAPR